jgi:hypothetical protein
MKEHRRENDAGDKNRAEDDNEKQSLGHPSPHYPAARNYLISRAPAAVRIS